MKIKDAHMQAYPFIEPEKDENIKAYHPGMTLRDYFATMAMQSFCSDPDWQIDMDFSNTAHTAYSMADAMMKARK